MVKSIRTIFLVCFVLLCTAAYSWGYADSSSGDGKSGADSASEAVWRLIGNGLANADIQSVAADPGDPKILYAGSAPNFGMAKAIYKTTDGGANWFASDGGFPSGAYISGIYIDPLDYNTLYARHGQTALYRSKNKGETWTKLANMPEDVWCVAVYGSVLYVGGYSTVYVSLDSGDNWAPTYAPPGTGTYNAIWVQPGSTDHVIVAGAQIYETINGGHEWTPSLISSSLCPDGVSYLTSIDADPDNFLNILVGTWGCVVRSENGGTTWAGVANIEHVNTVRFDPFGQNAAYATSDSLGPSVVIKSTDRGTTWNAYGSGLPPSYQIRDFAVGPAANASAKEGTAYMAVNGKVYTTAPETTVGVYSPINQLLLE
ncbi:MAG: WD40/YVTN/BNR-like repeat-containing protein [Syntrophobacteraceae bacterium]